MFLSRNSRLIVAPRKFDALKNFFPDMLVLRTTRRIFAFTRALCWGETLVLLHVVSQGFFCNDGLSYNCFLIYYLCNIQVENIVVMPIMGYCFKYFTSNHVFHYYFFELSKLFLLV